MLDVAESRASRARHGVSLTPAHVLATVLLLVPVVVVSLAFWPGHMNADTLSDIDQVRRNDLTNRHAAILLALWGPFYDAGLGPGWVLTGQVIVFVAGTFLLLRSVMAMLPAALATAVVSLSPPVFSLLGLLGRDVWFTALLVLGFGLLAGVPGASPQGRRIRLVAALAVAWLALAARQNAAPAVVLLLIAWVALAGWTARWPGVRGTLAAVATGFALCVGLMITQVVTTAALDVRDAHPEQYLFTYDVAAISQREDENLLPATVMPDRRVATIDERFSVDDVVPLIAGPGAPISAELSDPAAADLSDAWRDAVLDHPLAYLDARWDIFWRQVSVTREPAQVFHPGIDGNPFGFVIRFPELNDAALDYLRAFSDETYQGDVVFTVFLYLLAGLLAGVWFLRRRPTPLGVCLGCFALSAVTFQIGLFLGAMGVQYRLEYPAVVVGLLSAVLLVAAALRPGSAHRP